MVIITIYIHLRRQKSSAGKPLLMLVDLKIGLSLVICLSLNDIKATESHLIILQDPPIRALEGVDRCPADFATAQNMR